MMQKSLRSFFDKIILWLLPLPFLGTPWWNILLFPFGIQGIEPLRKAVVYGVTILTAAMLFFKALTFWKKKESRRLLLLTATLPIAFGAFYLLAFLSLEHPAKFLVNAITEGCCIVACCSALMIVILEKREMEILRCARVYAVITSPIILYYCIRFYLPSADYYSNDLGVLSYMPLAYCCLMICIFLFLDAALFQCAQGRWGRATWVDFFLFVLYSAAITLSGTRGTVLCLLFFSLLLPFFFWKEKNALFFSVAALCAILLFSTVLSPAQGRDRIKSAVKETVSTIVKPVEPSEPAEPVEPSEPTDPVEPSEPSESEKPRGIWGLLSYENIDAVAEIVQKVDPSISDNPLNHISEAAYGEASPALERGDITEAEYARLMDMAEYLIRSSWGARLFLWTCAVREIQTAPLTGHGALYFQDQYETYPHNYFLEIATDFGLIAMCAVLALGLYTFLCLIRFCKKDLFLRAWLLYVFSSLPRYMIGTSMYAASAFVQMGFCVVLMIYLKTPRSIAKEMAHTSQSA